MAWRIVLASVLGAIVFMIWGFAFFAGGVGPADLMFRGAPDEEKALAALKENFPESGAYVLPSPTQGMEDPTFQERHRAGPLVHIFVQTSGEPVPDPKVFAMGFVHNLISAVLLALILAGAAPALPRFLQRWFALVLVALFAAVAQEGSGVIWWRHPASYHLWIAVYAVVGWGLAALPIAALVKARR